VGGAGCVGEPRVTRVPGGPRPEEPVDDPPDPPHQTRSNLVLRGTTTCSRQYMEPLRKHRSHTVQTGWIDENQWVIDRIGIPNIGRIYDRTGRDTQNRLSLDHLEESIYGLLEGAFGALRPRVRRVTRTLVRQTTAERRGFDKRDSPASRVPGTRTRSSSVSDWSNIETVQPINAAAKA
jgi:hypothetical protein